MKGFHLWVESTVRVNDGVVWLNDPNAICSARVLLNPRARPTTYLKTDSTPRMRIKSAVVPKDRSKSLEVTFELSADGKRLLVIAQNQFYIQLTTRGTSPGDIPPVGVSFPKGTPDRIAVSPGKQITLTVNAASTLWNPVTRTPWSDLPPGEYVLVVRVGFDKDQAFDYQWMGEWTSEEYKLVVK
jgi:hypothetical protein